MATDPHTPESAQQAEDAKYRTTREQVEQFRKEAPPIVRAAYEAKMAEFEGKAAVARKGSTPAGKVKASFNLLPEELDVLRALAGRLGTTVTNVVERAIRDEHFVQEQLAAGNRFAIVDGDGAVREIIWR